MSALWFVAGVLTPIVAVIVSFFILTVGFKLGKKWERDNPSTKDATK